MQCRQKQYLLRLRVYFYPTENISKLQIACNSLQEARNRFHRVNTLLQEPCITVVKHQSANVMKYM